MAMRPYPERGQGEQDKGAERGQLIAKGILIGGRIDAQGNRHQIDEHRRQHIELDGGGETLQRSSPRPADCP